MSRRQCRPRSRRGSGRSIVTIPPTLVWRDMRLCLFISKITYGDSESVREKRRRNKVPKLCSFYSSTSKNQRRRSTSSFGSHRRKNEQLRDLLNLQGAYEYGEFREGDDDRNLGVPNLAKSKRPSSSTVDS